MEKGMFLAFIFNLSALLIFAGISIHFNKWWVVLFAIFFTSFAAKTKKVQGNKESTKENE